MSTKEDVIIALLREVMGKVEAIIQQRERIKRKTAAGGRDNGVTAVQGSMSGLRLLRLLPRR